MSEPGRNRRECILTRNSPFGVSTTGTFRCILVRGHNVFDVKLWFDKDFAFFNYRSPHRVKVRKKQAGVKLDIL